MRRPWHVDAPLLPIAVSLMAGIAIGHDHAVSGKYTLTALALLLLFTALTFRWPRMQTAGILLSTAIIGMHLTVRQVALLHRPPQTQQYIVSTTPVTRGKTIVMDALSADGSKVRLRLVNKGYMPTIGSGLEVRSAVRPFTRHPLHYESQGYAGELFAWPGEWWPAAVSTTHLSRLQRVRLRMGQYRQQLLERYQRAGMPTGAYAIAAAMTLGDKSLLTPAIRKAYDDTGASHVLALSGLHLGIIYWFITLLTVGHRWRMASQCASIMAVWGFALLTGLAPSIVRASTMLTVYALMSIGYRERASINVLAFTAVCMLAVQPLMLFDVGFQLSFASVCSILLFFPLFQQLLGARYLQSHRLVAMLWGLATLSLSAQFGAAPLVAYYFGRFSTYFLLSNFVVVPGAYAVITLAAVLLMLPHPIVASMLTAVLSVMAQLLTAIAALPLASISPLHPSLVQVTLIYVIIACFFVLFSIFAPRREP